MAVSDRSVRRRALFTVPRSRGALSGSLIVLLGVWGSVIAYVGPTFDYAYSPDHSWTWTGARAWLELLPGAVAAVSGLLLILSRSRIVAGFAGWLAAAAGGWFVIGRDCAQLFHLGDPGVPTSSSEGGRLLETLGFFTGVGTLLLLLAAFALGRLSVRSTRDLHAAERAIEHEQQLAAQRALLEAERDEQAKAARDQAARDQAAQDAAGLAAPSAGAHRSTGEHETRV